MHCLWIICESCHLFIWCNERFFMEYQTVNIYKLNEIFSTWQHKHQPFWRLLKLGEYPHPLLRQFINFFLWIICLFSQGYSNTFRYLTLLDEMIKRTPWNIELFNSLCSCVHVVHGFTQVSNGNDIHRRIITHFGKIGQMVLTLP